MPPSMDENRPSTSRLSFTRLREEQSYRREETESLTYGDVNSVAPGIVSEKDAARLNSISTCTGQLEPELELRSIKSSKDQYRDQKDDIEMLKVERQISRQAEGSTARSGSYDMHRSRSRRVDEHLDEFDIATNPVHEQTRAYKPILHPTTRFGRFVKRVHRSTWLVRYCTYITPPTLILLIPLLLGALVYKEATVGGVYLLWFMIWLEIVWLTLWAGRILAKCLPWPIGVISSLFTDNGKKWRDMGKQLEVPATLFFWWLAIEVSFLPTMTYHQKGHGSGHVASWMNTMNKVLVSIFVGVILNFVAKIIIQLIAISFHLRTYADRIEINKFQIGSLTKLYKFSKDQIAMEDREFEVNESKEGSGTLTPGILVAEAAKRTKKGFNILGDVAGKIAGDFTGRQTMQSTHPYQVVLALLNSTSGAQILARRLYRTFVREGSDTVVSDDLSAAFDNDDEASAAFTMFDKDLNGDISMEELEAVCVEIGRERKSITASLKDLDSVVGKLDDMFMFVVAAVTVLVFLSLISTSAAGVLTSAGSAVLALSWLLSATAQEFLQSCIFVFVKHPFDVGDRVTIYGNTGSSLKGDDYFVKEISLLYTEFKKMEGHVVQAPNSYLNTLFILNQRRSGGLAEAVSITVKFGTTLEQIEGLRNKLLEFVVAEKREYQSNILTELRDIVDVYSLNLNVIFFYKSNWQNEGLRLARRNKFICALMVSMQELSIEGPLERLPGQRQSFPIYLQNVPHVQVPGAGHSGTANVPGGMVQQETDTGMPDLPSVTPPSVPDLTQSSQPDRSVSAVRSLRPRGESLSLMDKRMDFSLGAKSTAIDNLAGDVYEGRFRPAVPPQVTEASRERRKQDDLRRSLERTQRQSVDEDFRSPARHMSPRGYGNVGRRSTTDSGSQWRRVPSHRNRFFGRATPALDDQAILESGMADIPEAIPGATSRSNRLDARTGLVSPQAISASQSTVGIDAAGDFHSAHDMPSAPEPAKTQSSTH